MKNAYETSVIDYFLSQFKTGKMEIKFSSKQAVTNYFELLEHCRDSEKKQKRLLIETSFEDGVGEGMTDPERPFSGKEYFDIKYNKP